ncbi:stimulated by retinoic acid gene 6 protein-like isoform X1 [Astyanax mexicanus]|uniref:Stimulated by retinoic acid gene 6 protein-like isoform X1 n=1 Tax=Astyanax mexicanus TaxID=7994 RepID=A0A8T2KKP4_ASTMX|nr:stimulated by retinoic acid gene 6 protein-like isoform X1 [Astyanax mexicanus]
MSSSEVVCWFFNSNDSEIDDDFNPEQTETNTTVDFSDDRCHITREIFLHACILPSLFIVLLLSFLERRRKVYSFEERFPYLRGRFGIVVPMDFTGTLRNRWSYAFAVGATTPLMIDLLSGDILPFEVPDWIITLVYLVAAFEVAVAFLPFFACLSTKHRGLGGTLGLLYTLAWFIVAVWNFRCEYNVCDPSSFFVMLLCYGWLFDWPYFLCLGFLLGRFGFMLVKSVKICLQKNNQQEEEDEVFQSHQYKHVQRLLKRPPAWPLQKTWIQRNIYIWDPYFKFPNRMIATAVISIIALYMIISLEQVFSTVGLKYQYPPIWTLLGHVDYAWNTWYATTALSTLASITHVGHTLMCYRKHMKRLWAGNKSFLPNNGHVPHSAVSVVALAKYPGCQIAFTIWGYLIVHIALFVFGMIFVYLVVVLIRCVGLGKWLINLLIFLSNFLIVIALLMLQILLVQVFFLQEKIKPENKEKPLALNNRKAFHNFNYFFFFYNVILGLGSCILRLFGSTFVGLLLISRINLTIMPKGFEMLDKGYQTWIGMIMADHYHSSPVMVCFCHLLLKRTLERHKSTDAHSRLNRTSGSPAEVRARAHWHVSYTLLRNPKLIMLRKHRKHSSDNRDQLAVARVMLQMEQVNTSASAEGNREVCVSPIFMPVLSAQLQLSSASVHFSSPGNKR